MSEVLSQDMVLGSSICSWVQYARCMLNSIIDYYLNMWELCFKMGRRVWLGGRLEVVYLEASLLLGASWVLFLLCPAIYIDPDIVGIAMLAIG